MIIIYKDIFGQDQQINVDGILENIIQGYQYEISELKTENEKLQELVNKTERCTELYREKMRKVKDEL